MHIPDGYLGPPTYAALWAAMLAIWRSAAIKVKKTMKAAETPLLALGAAVSFVIMMFNVPVVGGTTGHATGSALLSIVLGPWAAVIAVSIALAVQALLFGDGGITSYGANCFNMAFVGAIVGGAVYRMLRATGGKKKRTVLAAGLAGYASLNASALCAALELGVQPLLHHAADGRPLYSPFPLSVTIPAIVGAHLAVYGLVEAAFTMLAVAYIQKAYPELLKEKGNPQ